VRAPLRASQDEAQHVERLAAYWGETLGGPGGYTARDGDHSHMLRSHAGSGEHAEIGDVNLQWRRCTVIRL
jgi:hemoglobin